MSNSAEPAEKTLNGMQLTNDEGPKEDMVQPDVEAPHFIDMADVEKAVDISERDDVGTPMDSSDEEDEDSTTADNNPTSDATASGSLDKSVRRFTGHKEPVYCVALFPSPPVASPTANGSSTSTVSPGPGFAITGGGDDLAYMWRVATGEVMFRFSGHKDSVSQVCYNHDGSCVATGSMDGDIKIWDTSNGSLLFELDAGDDIHWLTFHPRGNFIVAGTASGSLYMWLVKRNSSSEPQMSFFGGGHTDICTCGIWSPDGRTLISGSEDGSIVQWSPKKQAVLTRFDGKMEKRFERGVASVAAHPDNIIVAGGCFDGRVIIANTKSCKVVGVLEDHTDSVEDVKFSSSGLLATASLDSTFKIYETSSLQLRNTFTHEAAVIQLNFSLPGTAIQTVTSCALDGTIRVWDTRDGSCIHLLTGHSDPQILAFAQTSDARFIVTAGEDSDSLVFEI